MIELENTIISDQVLDSKFVCDLQKCKGECCISGASGAPLENSEIDIIKNNLEEIKPYLNKESLKIIETEGVYYSDHEGNHFTTLVKSDGACSFVIFDEDYIAKCAIEAAYNDKKIPFKKPISCHLYPIRIRRYDNFETVNYHERNMCKPACECGINLGIKVYQFLKEALIRKYGLNWFNKLEEIDKLSS